MSQYNETPEMFLFYENWKNLFCLDQHLASAHFQTYAAAVEDLLIEKIVQKMTEIS
ncbi:putative quinol monooxygenase [Geobacter sp. SVR]|uniref:putative quinol monooxygenase n=1 Tax=Geobacter sp. SVR TaxID=2495594 RepID=UPI00143F02BA|nr:antibiotic biosynthesis monooxygenase [Geobacter sp. SVR]BCS51767.1 hypothetical protein GSVR_00750 [Geobacter sp. SVR]GCF87046.1 hypothetical protein GSbR_36460 [Geobacter sp. SVR]